MVGDLEPYRRGKRRPGDREPKGPFDADYASPVQLAPLDSDEGTRAMRAFHRRCIHEGWIDDQPGANGSGVYRYDGEEYVVLGNVNGVLAVY
jgi:hypothetical protein